MTNEYEWLEPYDSPRPVATARDEVLGGVVSVIAVLSILMLFGL